MGLQDLIVTPIYLVIFTLLALWVRPFVTTSETKKYFLPALWARFGGAIALGLIYQFYYGGGDTFNYWTHGSRWIWEAFGTDPVIGISMIFGENQLASDNYYYSSKIWYFNDPSSYFIVRLAAFFDIFTFHTYSATALFFSLISFSGAWSLFHIFQKIYAKQRRYLALGILFIPSVLLWGSGILKDTVTLACLSWLTWIILDWTKFGRRNIVRLGFAALSILILALVKVYLLMAFLPVVFVWYLIRYIYISPNPVFRLVFGPLMICMALIGSYYGVLQIGKINKKYSLEQIAMTSRVTAYDIRYGWGARVEGDGGYDIGIPDGTLSGMVSLFPKGVVVSMFRPYLWEVRNPLMLLSAIEGLLVLLLFLRSLTGFGVLFKDPLMIFCLLFAVFLAFAVGVSTSNFGTLSRYKIPMMPFIMAFMIVAITQRKTRR